VAKAQAHLSVRLKPGPQLAPVVARAQGQPLRVLLALVASVRQRLQASQS
jgi:hypothetical protein